MIDNITKFTLLLLIEIEIHDFSEVFVTGDSVTESTNEIRQGAGFWLLLVSLGEKQHIRALTVFAL